MQQISQSRQYSKYKGGTLNEKSKAGSAVFVVSLVLIAIMAIWSVALNESFTKVSNAAFTFLTTDFGWLYLLA